MPFSCPRCAGRHDPADACAPAVDVDAYDGKHVDLVRWLHATGCGSFHPTLGPGRFTLPYVEQVAATLALRRQAAPLAHVLTAYAYALEHGHGRATAALGERIRAEVRDPEIARRYRAGRPAHAGPIGLEIEAAG